MKRSTDNKVAIIKQNHELSTVLELIIAVMKGKKKKLIRASESLQQLGTLATSPKDLGSIP